MEQQQQQYTLDGKSVHLIYQLMTQVMPTFTIAAEGQNILDLIINSMSHTQNHVGVLLNIMKLTGKKIVEIVPDDDVIKKHDLTNEIENLKNLFNQHKSDKHFLNQYEKIYGYVFNVLQKKNDIKKVLEIGLGTRNKQVPGNMTWNNFSECGGSIRAWRDYLPTTQIYGCDVDRTALFQEERIKTYFVDQLSPKTFDDLLVETGGEFDVIIDDGLHYVHANLNSFAFALRALKAGGVFVLEDVDIMYSKENHLFWQMVGGLLPSHYHYEIIKCKMAHVVIFQKK